MEKRGNICAVATGVGLFFSGLLLGLLISQSCHVYRVHSVTQTSNNFHSKITVNAKSSNSTEQLQPIHGILEKSTTPDSKSHEIIYDYYAPEEVETVTRLENTKPTRYFVSPPNDKLNWFGALQACAGLNMELVSIDTGEKSTEVGMVIKNAIDTDYDDSFASDDFWSAGTNLWTPKLSEFHWATSGTKIDNFTNWHAGTPNRPEEQHCIEITKSIDSPTSGSYKWNDYGCHIPARYICEGPLLLV